MKKGCPEKAALFLCEDGWVSGIPLGLRWGEAGNDGGARVKIPRLTRNDHACCIFDGDAICRSAAGGIPLGLEVGA